MPGTNELVETYPNLLITPEVGWAGGLAERFELELYVVECKLRLDVEPYLEIFFFLMEQTLEFNESP